MVERQTSFLAALFGREMIFSSRADVSPAMPPIAFEDIVKELHQLTSCSSAIVLDLRSFHAPPTPPPRRGSANPEPVLSASPPPLSGVSTTHPRRPSYPRMYSGITSATSTSSASGGEWYSSVSSSKHGNRTSASDFGTVCVLGTHGDDWNVNMEGIGSAVSHHFVSFYNEQKYEFDDEQHPSPLANMLPEGTTASLIVPIFDHDGEPALLMMCCSSERYFTFEPADRNFVESVGAVIIGSLLRKRIIEADQAKLQFVVRDLRGVEARETHKLIISILSRSSRTSSARRCMGLEVSSS